MTYKDIVLKLLKTRDDLVCIEQHLISDFKENSNTGESFSDWCDLHGIDYIKIEQEQPTKVHLKKKFNYENN